MTWLMISTVRAWPPAPVTTPFVYGKRILSVGAGIALLIGRPTVGAFGKSLGQTRSLGRSLQLAHLTGRPSFGRKLASPVLNGFHISTLN